MLIMDVCSSCEWFPEESADIMIQFLTLFVSVKSFLQKIVASYRGCVIFVAP